MEMILLGIAIILFGSSFVPGGAGFALFGWFCATIGLVISLIGFFKKDNRRK